MYKLLIVDDEPLVQVGIKSMINWEEAGISVCGTAANGSEALELIKRYSPEIVITDIKMPIMNGLELIKECHSIFADKSADLSADLSANSSANLPTVLPLFIILTSYEEFQLVKEAIKYQVLDYLVKLELDHDVLLESINKAINILKKSSKMSFEDENAELPSLQVLQDKFFMRLLHNLFEDEDEFKLHQRELNINLNANGYATAYCEIFGLTTDKMSSKEQATLYTNTIQMIKEISNKHMTCYVISLDMKHFGIIFLIDELSSEYNIINSALRNSFEMVNKYFNVNATASVGKTYTNAFMIADSYQEARQIGIYSSLDEPIRFYDKLDIAAPSKNTFNISLFKKDIVKAFEELDTDILNNIFTQLNELFKLHPTAYLQSIDVTCNILYLAISLLPDGETIISEIFIDYPDGYRSIYRQNNVEQVIEWLSTLNNGLCNMLKERRASYKNHIIINVQKYINSHVQEKLSLNDVSLIFGISPNYLSTLFKKSTDIGFTDYVNQSKIKVAKQLMNDSNLKIYEIADKLGFESAFYFSKVFKKIEGSSPRDYIQNCCGRIEVE